MATVTYPGVYIEEEFSLSMSVVAGATAVPVIAYASAVAGESALTKPLRLSSWLDFVSHIETQKDGGTKLKVDFSEKSHASVRAYFENGGGYCYLLAPDNFELEVPKLDDVTMLVAAGQTIPGTAVTALCGKGKSRFLIQDGPSGGPTDGTTLPSGGTYLGAQHGATYYPWLEADWASTTTQSPPADPVTTYHPVPPSAAVAGVYCSVDRERGVWKAPANVALKGGLRPRFKVSDILQGAYMDGPTAVNMIREFRGTGALVWGTRTLAAPEDRDAWKYIPVRRLFDTAERDIKRAASVVVFEPNSPPTWEKVRSAIDNYLYGIWREGGLLGNTQEEAYFVQIGKGITMTGDDIMNGRMIVKIGMAAVRPAEFIILQFTQEVGRG